MDVDAATLDRLLDLQAEDSAIRRLQDRKSSLPEAARLREVTDRLSELTADYEIARRQLDDIAREQARLEGEMEVLEEKIAREEQRMYSGSVANPKELSSLQSEVEMLKRKKAEGEDLLLEVMVNRESAGSTAESLSTERSEAEREAEELQAAVEHLTREIDEELAGHTARRAEVTGSIPAALLRTYDGIRESRGGVGAAELVGGTCQGCHTKLPQVEVERVTREGGLQRCDNCRRILVVR